MEPAGALSVAGLKSWSAAHPAGDRRLVAILSGANMNFDRLRFVAERAEVGEAREALLGVTIPEKPGAFRAFCAAIGPRVVTEFNYRLAGREAAHIFVGLRTASREDGLAVARDLRERGYATLDLTDDEMAKLHVRYMVGAREERLYRFEFPERPGALLQFLDTLGGRFNISLFHYRNHGADFGRVLAAFEVPDAQLGEFRSFLDRLGYPSYAEDANPAYALFLAGNGG
jgi:threonine dehydratase